MKTKRILHLIDSGGIYGAEVMLLNLMEQQRDHGIIPILGSFRAKGEDRREIDNRAKKLGLEITTFPAFRGIRLDLGRRIVRWASENRIDIIHTHGFKPNLVIALLPRRMSDIPLVRTLHGWTSMTPWSKMGAYQILDRYGLRYCDAVYAVSDAMTRSPSLKRTKLDIGVIPNGIEKPRKSPGPDENEDEIGRFRTGGEALVSIGRLSEEKGFDLLIAGMAKMRDRGRDVRLCIIGDGPLRPKLENLIRELKLGDRVLLPGYRENASRFIPLFDGYVLSSHTEGLPITILEAMHMGIPIAATEVGGVPEALEMGKAGYLFRSNDPEDLAAGLTEFLADKGYRVNIAEKARNRAERIYSASAMEIRYAEAYRRLGK